MTVDMGVTVMTSHNKNKALQTAKLYSDLLKVTQRESSTAQDSQKRGP